MRRAEQEVIGALLTDGGRIAEVWRMLQPGMFTDEILGRIFNEYQAAWEKHETPAYTEVIRRVVASGAREVFVTDAVKECVSMPVTSTSIKGNAKVIAEEWRAKQVSNILSHTIPGADIDQTIRETITSLEALMGKTEAAKTLGQIAKESKEEYFTEQRKPKMDLGIFPLDDAIGGIEGGDVVLIAARPAVGKSALALQIIRSIAKTKKVAYYNLEMREQQVYERFLASEGGLRMERVRRAKEFLGDEKERFERANNKLEGLNNIVVFSGSKSVADIRATVSGFDAIVIDYLQLLKTDGKRGANRYAEVGDVSRSIKAIAMDYNIPVIALSQLNRASERSADKEPTMADLRESGDLEQDASVILMLWNPNRDDRDRKKLKVEKARQGKMAVIDLIFRGETMTFEQPEPPGMRWNDD